MGIEKTFDERKALQLLAEGSEFAFIQLFDKYRPRIYAASLKFLDSKEQAEEVVQDVFMEVWLRRESMIKVVNFNAYLHAMVRNQVYDTYRAQTAMRDAAKELRYSTFHVNETEASIKESDYNRLLQDAVNQLPQQQKEIFLLARKEDLTHEEIGVRLHLTRLAVKAHMQRALRFLRDKLEPHFLNNS
jgi:RNA polymerase sigma-70 factor (family 1)